MVRRRVFALTKRVTGALKNNRPCLPSLTDYRCRLVQCPARWVHFDNSCFAFDARPQFELDALATPIRMVSWAIHRRLSPFPSPLMIVSFCS